MEPVDSSSDDVLPPEIMDDEDTDPGPAPEHHEDEPDEYEDDFDEHGEDHDDYDEEQEGDYEEAREEEQEEDFERETMLFEDAEAPLAEPSSRPPVEARDDPDPAEEEEEDSEGLRLPWLNLIVIGLYVVLGGSCLVYDHHTSEWSQIERHMSEGDALMGERMGAGSSIDELIEAAEHYLAALAIDKHLERPHRRLDQIKARLEERRSSLPTEMERHHAALSSRAKMERAESRQSMWSKLPITPEKRFGLRDKRNQLRRNVYIFAGGLLALAGWMVINISFNQARSREARGPQDSEDDGRFIS